jgi:two-component system phosphate regulon response regulator PhoB/two-component system alkaline phosphatase synthesis response regulator PhoP
VEKTTVVGGLVINPGRFEVTVEGKPVVVTSTEFKILELLCSRRGWVFTREKILDHLWGDEKAVLDRTVDVHIKNLREKLGGAKHLIKNVRGIGYKLEE